MAPDENATTACLQQVLDQQYGVSDVLLERLHWGADADSIAYRVRSHERQSYFLKLRLGSFDPVSLALPRYLHDQGIPHIVPPTTTKSHQLWVESPAGAVMLYPFVDGQNGFVRELSDLQWIEFGRTMRTIHDLPLPSELLDQIRKEAFSSVWRDSVVLCLGLAHSKNVHGPLASRTATLLREKSQIIMRAVNTAERLAQRLQEEELPFVNCHYDLHAGNVLLPDDQQFFVVDWDNPIRAPRERDLMFIGAGIGRTWNSKRESDLFSSRVWPDADSLPSPGVLPIGTRGRGYRRLRRGCTRRW